VKGIVCNVGKLVNLENRPNQRVATCLYHFPRKKSKRGRKKTVCTRHQFYSNPDCDYYLITDDKIHALVDVEQRQIGGSGGIQKGIESRRTKWEQRSTVRFIGTSVLVVGRFALSLLALSRELAGEIEKADGSQGEIESERT
jgi:hypothetical protein